MIYTNEFSKILNGGIIVLWNFTFKIKGKGQKQLKLAKMKIFSKTKLFGANFMQIGL